MVDKVELKDPIEVAKGAVDRLCHYDPVRQSTEEFYAETADAVGDFARQLVFEIAVRLAEAANYELNRDKIKEIDEAIQATKTNFPTGDFAKWKK